MALDTTTSDPVESAAAQEAATTEAAAAAAEATQAETQTEAVNENEDTSQTGDSGDSGSDESTDSADNSDEAEIKEWAAKKNLPLDDPIKIAKMYRESEKQLGKKGQQEGQLKAAVTTANTEAGNDDVQSLRNEVTALSFYIQHPEAKQYETEMVSILEDKPWLANDLEVVLDAAKGRSGTEAQRIDAAKKAGKQEALAQAEKSGRAAPPQASASNSKGESSNTITMDNVDELIARNGHDWYVKNRDKIEKVLAGN